MKKLPIILVCVGGVLSTIGFVVPLIALNLPYYPVSTIMGSADTHIYWLLFHSLFHGLLYWLTSTGFILTLIAIIIWIALRIKKSNKYNR